jgi:hypothetical protein
LQKISISKGGDQTSNLEVNFIDKTTKLTSQETTQKDSTLVSMVIESDTSSTTEGNLLKLNLVNTT